MRAATALLCLALSIPLAACFQSGAPGDAQPELNAAPVAATAAAATTAPAEPAPAAVAPAMPAGRGATAPRAAASAQASAAASKKEKDEAWTEGGVTREKINGMCWMKYETGRRDLPVEKRADLVNQCVIDTMKKYPPTN